MWTICFIIFFSIGSNFVAWAVQKAKNKNVVIILDISEGVLKNMARNNLEPSVLQDARTNKAGVRKPIKKGQKCDGHKGALIWSQTDLPYRQDEQQLSPLSTFTSYIFHQIRRISLSNQVFLEAKKKCH